ncbi:hypothetical protein ABZ791_02475 [Streptomyces huasconensis]|uniref:Transposase n=1 Tax=Streptomyces huasconensis TaxID=1854574 RepID=A0ABV3LSS6_9ACTN
MIQVYGKGIAMRPSGLRPATLKAHLKTTRAMRTCLAPGEKPHRKRMATPAGVFDADPAPGRPHDIIAPPEGRSGLRSPPLGPRSRAKWLTGSVIHPPEHTIAAAFDQAQARDRDHVRTWVVLVDGAGHQLDLIRAESGSGRPLGSKNRHPAIRYDVGKTARRSESITERDQLKGGSRLQNGTAIPASRNRSSAMPMHSATEAPSALIPPSSGPPEAANVHAG